MRRAAAGRAASLRVTASLAASRRVAAGLAASLTGVLLLSACGDRSGEGDAAVDELVTPGVSRALASHRAERISDLRYDLFFSISEASPIVGTARIALRLPEGREPLVLDFLADEESVGGVRVNGRESAGTLRDGHLVVPSDRLRAGRNELEISFTAADGPLNRQEDFLYTLFVPDRAHRAFPAFDQPNLRARFRLVLEVPAEWEAVANAPLAAEESSEGRRRLTYEETEPIPTYLFAFAAGRFQVEEEERGGRRMRLYHRETDAEKVARNLEAIFDLHARALAWMEEYTGIPYPFGKFDFVAVPAFQYNGMEHPGAILYRAERLFLDPSATRGEELARASVIAHETAHMWFGNLVTMPWFDDVWMKEVFANFMAAKMVEPAFPDLDHDVRFLLAHQPAAYAVDRTGGANPIRQELDNLAEAGTLYGPIIYQKAPVVMRQLELLVGEEGLRAGLRDYLERHAFGNASWPDLIAILDGLTERDLGEWSRVWVEEPGRPWVGVELEEEGGRINSLRVVQHDPAGEGRVWPQRIGVLLGGTSASDSAEAPSIKARTSAETPSMETRTSAEASSMETHISAEAPRPESRSLLLPVVLDGPATEVPDAVGLPVPRFALPDATGLGYGLFLLDSHSREQLLAPPAALAAVEPPVARAGAWLSLWDEMLEGRVAPARLLEAGLALARPEEDELLVERALADLVTVWWRFLSASERTRWATRLEETLWARMHQAETASRQAAYLEAFGAMAITGQGALRMRGLWSGSRQVPGLELSERDQTRLAQALAVREAPGWAEVLARQAERIENPDRRARFEFVRPAADADPEVRAGWFAALAEPEVRRREPWVLEGLSLLHHPLRADASLRFIRPSLEMLPEIQRTGDIFFPARWLDATLGGHASPEAAEVVREFLDSWPDLPPRLREKVYQSADLLFRASGAAAEKIGGSAPRHRGESVRSAAVDSALLGRSGG